MTIQYGLFIYLLIIDQMYDLTLGQNGHISLKTNQKNHVFSCPMFLIKIDILIKLNLLKNRDFL